MGMGRVWEKFDLGITPILEKRGLTSLASKNPKTYSHSLMHSRFHLSSRFWRAAGHFFIIHPSFTLSSLAAELSWVFILHVISCFLIFYAQ